MQFFHSKAVCCSVWIKNLRFHVGRILKRSLSSDLSLHKNMSRFIIKTSSNWLLHCFNLKCLSLSVYMILETTEAVTQICYKGFVNIFAKFAVKHLCWSLFFSEATTGGVLLKNGVLKNFANSQENTCASVSFLIKL